MPTDEGHSGEATTRLAVVAIGASAGGVEAFRDFFSNTPADSGLAFIVMLHLPANRQSILPDILSRWTTMRVYEIADGTMIHANTVYVPPAGVAVVYENRRFTLLQIKDDQPRELNPISVLFSSLAEALGEDAVGVVLSGTGSDGALGLKAIKERGGLTVVQGNGGHGPLHDGMPSSAIATGAVDIIVPVAEMPGRILEVVQGTRLSCGRSVVAASRPGPERAAGDLHGTEPAARP